MPNTSSPSLDISQLLGPEELERKPPLTDFVEQVAAEEFGRVKAAARWSRQYDPEAYAQAKKLAPGVPPEVAVRQLELVKDNARLGEYQKIFETSPQLQSYFSTNPKDLPLANPDELDNVHGLSWIFQAGSQAAASGMTDIYAAFASNRQAAGTDTIQDRALLANYDPGNRTFGAQGFWEEAWIGLAQQTALLTGTAVNSAVGALKGGAYGGSAGAVAGSVLPGIGTVAGMTSGLLAGARAGSMTGGFEFQRKINTGLARIELQKIRDEDGNPLDPETIELTANIVGAGGAALEYVAFRQLMSVIPGSEVITNLFSVRGMSSAMRNAAIRKALGTAAKNVGKVIGTEVTTEVLQQGLQIAGEEIAKANAEGDFQQRTQEEIIAELGKAAYQAFQVSLLLGSFASGTRLGGDLIHMNRESREQKKLQKAAEAVQDNKFLERAPDVAAKVIDTVQPETKVYIPAQEALELYQGQGLDIYGPELPNWRSRFDEALATGGNVEITLGEFLSYIARDPKQQPLKALAMTSPQGFTSAEIEEYTATMQDLLKSEFARAQAAGLEMPVEQAQPRQRSPEADAIFKDFREQIVKTGFAPQAAEHYAAMLSAFFTTMAQRAGMTPEQFMASHGLQIVRETEEGKRSRVSDGNQAPATSPDGEPLEVFQPAWHGSPHLFEEFSLEKLGSGEGAQAFGWGLYFAEKRSIAEFYRDKLSREAPSVTVTLPSGEKSFKAPTLGRATDAIIDELKDQASYPITNVEALGLNTSILNILNGTPLEEEIADFTAYLRQVVNEEKVQRNVELLRSLNVSLKKAGRLFQVDLPEDDQILNWEKHLTEQSPEVQAALLKLNAPIGSTGQGFYEQLSAQLGSDQAASEALRSVGILGHKFHDASSRGREDRDTYNFVIYDDKAIKVTEFFQENRGAIRLGEQSIITLFEKADLSTLLHESGHFFLNTLRDLAPNSPELQADWDKLRKHLGIAEDGKITRDQHEKFARMTEAYFMEGKAPAPELRPAFESFRRWLKALYRRSTALGGYVKPEIREVFDRMFVTDQRFEELAADRAYAPVFKSAEEMGVSPEDYAKYQQLLESLKADALDEVREKVEGQVTRQSKGWRGEILKELTRQAEEKLKKTPPYNHLARMRKHGSMIDVKIFKEMYSVETAKRFPRNAFKVNGVHPDIVAEILGYPKADDMVNDVLNAPPIKQAAKELAQKEMIAKYGEDFSIGATLDAAVQRALAADQRVSVLATEFEALSKKANRYARAPQAKELAVQIARNTIYRKKVGEVKERDAAYAVQRAARQADSAIVKGDWVKAADWKRRQMLAQAIHNETKTIADTIEKIRSKAARYSRKASESIDPASMAQIRALVEQYEFTKVPLKKLARRESLRQYLDKAEAEGFVVTDIPDRLLRQLERVNYKELSVEDLLGLGDTLDNIEHIGRLKNKLHISKRKREWAEIKGKFIESLEALPKRKKVKDTYFKDKETLGDRTGALLASLKKPEQIIEWLDAGNIKGPAMEYIFQPIVEAQNERNDLNAEYNAKLVEIFEDIDSSYLSETRNIKSLNHNMSMEQIYAVALNTGNQSNYSKLMMGELWTPAQLEEVLSYLSREDWQRIQKIWDLMDSLWDRIAVLEKRLTGVTPPKIEARSFTNAHGEWRGGYYPVVYDFQTRRGIAELEDVTPEDRKLRELRGLEFDNTFIRPGTNHKHTIARTKVAKPIKTSLSVVPGHIHNVIHDLTHREAVRAIGKILWDPEITRLIEDAEGRFTVEQLQHWIKMVATEHATETDPLELLIRRVRVGATMYGMGYRLTTAISQILGFSTSLVRVPKRHLASAVYQMSRHPIKTFELVAGLSGEMRHRFNQQDRDIRDTVKKFSLKETKLDKVRYYAFSWISAADRYTSTATWLGAYTDYLERNPADEAAARMHADRTVRLTQGTGTAKDMAKVMNSSEMMRLFTMFYSFFSAQYNMQVDLTRKTRRDIAARDWDTLFRETLPKWAYLVVFPAVFGAVLSGDLPEDDESYAWWAMRKTLLYPAAAVPIVRDIVSPLDRGFRYKFSPAGRFFESSSSALEQLLVDHDIPGALKPAVQAAGVWMRLPLGQPYSIAEALWLGLAENDFEYADLLFGRRDK